MRCNPTSWVASGRYGQTCAEESRNHIAAMSPVTMKVSGLPSCSPIVIVVYRAAVTGGTLTTCHECDRVEWVAPADIPWAELAFPSTDAALREFLSGRTV